MNNLDKKKLFQTINVELSKLGFERKKKDWYKATNDLILVINFQHSDYSDSYYINLGIFVREIDSKNLYPKENKTHFRMRFQNLIEESDWVDFLDLENQLNLEQRETYIRTIFKDKMSEFINNIFSIKKLIETYKTKKYQNLAAFSYDALNTLGIEAN